MHLQWTDFVDVFYCLVSGYFTSVYQARQQIVGWRLSNGCCTSSRVFCSFYRAPLIVSFVVGHSSVAVRRLYVSVPCCFLLVCYSFGDLKNRSDIVLRPNGLPDQTEVQIRTWIRSDCKTYHDQHITFVTIGTYLLQIVVNDAIDEWC